MEKKFSVVNVVNVVNVIDVAEKENDVGEMSDERERFSLLLIPISHVT
jgi:hypothetical protein